MDRYAVFGFPIKHSRSPWIHARFAIQTNQSLTYTAQEMPPDSFEQQVLEFFSTDGCGLNITVPFKERACQIAEVLSEAATTAGAVNTLYRNALGQLCGDNTDGVGMLRDIIQNQGGVVAGKTVLIVGAGGAVRGVLPNLLAEKPARVCIVNRTVERAEALASRFAGHGHLDVMTYAGLEGQSFDLIINGASAGLDGSLPPLPSSIVNADSWCYDMMYGAGPTVFQRWANECGAAKALDGVGMLVEQAAQAFNIWRGITPETASIITALRAELSLR